MDAINIQQLTFHFAGQKAVLKDLTATFPTGSCNLIMGPSGCGKSTLLKIIAHLLPKYGGTLTSGHIDFPDKHPQIGMLFQDPAMQFALDTPRHEIEFALENQQLSADVIHQRLQDSLAFCRIETLADRKITTLSGGQQQRVALAVIIAMRPDILLLDEPFASIDEPSRQFLIQRLVELKRQRPLTLIITDHDCHGYRPLTPRIWDFTNQQLLPLTAQQTNHRLITADQSASIPIHSSIPRANDVPAIELTNFLLARSNNQLITSGSLPIIKNKITLLTGANGSGKSSLFKALTKLIPYQGTISYQHHNIQKISPGKYYQQVGLVFQKANDQFLNVTVGEELALSSQHCRQPLFTNGRLHHILAEFGLAGLEERVVYTLSGGQRKKLQLLLMLMIGQPVLLLDEPFAGLDRHSLALAVKLIRQCQQTLPQTVVIISHQLTGLEGLIDFHLTLHNHQLIYRGISNHEP